MIILNAKIDFIVILFEKLNFYGGKDMVKDMMINRNTTHDFLNNAMNLAIQLEILSVAAPKDFYFIMGYVHCLFEEKLRHEHFENRDKSA
jgi:hypothetical protein